MAPMTWVYYLRKEDLVTYLEEFNLEIQRTVDELRKRLAQFIAEQGEVHEERLKELSIRHAKISSPKPNDQLPSAETKTFTLPQSLAPRWDLPSRGTTPIPAIVPTDTTSQVKESTHTLVNVNCHHTTTNQPVINEPRFVRNPEIAPMEKVQKWTARFGGGRDALAFIERTDELAALDEISKDAIPRVMSELLQERALTWYRCNKKAWVSWTHFKADFLTVFLPPRYFEQLSDTIRQRRQLPRESFMGYVINIQKLLHHSQYNEDQKLERIFRNCRAEYQFYIKRDEFQTLEELLKLASDNEAIREYAGRTEQSNTNRPPMERNRQINHDPAPQPNIDVQCVCRRCGQQGHFSRNCQNPQVLFR